MPVQSAAVTVSHLSAPNLRIVNPPILRRLPRTPLAGIARKQRMVLGVNGRKTTLDEFTEAVRETNVGAIRFSPAGEPRRSSCD